jgi:hypothetical protein
VTEGEVATGKTESIDFEDKPSVLAPIKCIALALCIQIARHPPGNQPEERVCVSPNVQ